MNLGAAYPWVVFLHVIGVLGFVLVHGISAGVLFKLRGEREQTRIQALLDLSNAYLSVLYAFLLLILATGIAAGVMGGWWTSGQLWLWASLALFIALMVAMYLIPVPYFDRLRHAVGLQTYDDRRKNRPAPEPLGNEELEALLASPRGYLAAIVGIGGIAVLTWLMMFKPF